MLRAVSRNIVHILLSGNFYKVSYKNLLTELRHILFKSLYLSLIYRIYIANEIFKGL